MKFLKKIIHLFGNIHFSSRNDIFILTTPRSGSNWLSELLCSGSYIKGINEPFDLRSLIVQDLLKTDNWEDLYNDKSEDLVLNYLQDYSNGRFLNGIKNMPPFNREHAFISFRIVFKILHACEDKVNLLSNSFKTKILFLIRHPIPVTISRDVYPRLDVLVKKLKPELNKNQNDLIEKTIKLNDNFKNGIIDWTLQNYFILKNNNSSINLVTYEQLVQSPEIVVEHLAHEYSLSKFDMIKNIKRASNTSHKSDIKTISKLKDTINYDQKYLLNKWVDKVDDDQKLFVNDVLNTFEIDIYNAHSSLPKESYLIK